MTALRKPIANTVPAVDVFRERCKARAILVEACALDLHTAVDGLQEAAVATGLVDEIGQDAVQKMMAHAFASLPIVLSGNSSDVLLGNVGPTVSGAARSTLQAAEYLVRQNDPARLKAWLAKHSRVERNAIKQHLRAKR
jgi:hypothetical protein